MSVRSDAALICAVCASDPGEFGCSYLDAARALWGDPHGHERALGLALAAWARVEGELRSADFARTDAEAEALLRSGWRPRSWR